MASVPESSPVMVTYRCLERWPECGTENRTSSLHKKKSQPCHIRSTVFEGRKAAGSAALKNGRRRDKNPEAETPRIQAAQKVPRQEKKRKSKDRGRCAHFCSQASPATETSSTGSMPADIERRIALRFASYLRRRGQAGLAVFFDAFPKS